MPKLDISKAAFSGVALTSLEYIIEAPEVRSVTKSAVDGSLLALSDLLVQSLAGGNMDELRTFLYKEHEALTIATVYTLVQELKDIFYDSGYDQYQSVFPKIVANLFLAAGSISVGSSVNRMLGMDDNMFMGLIMEPKKSKDSEKSKSKSKGKREVWNE